MKQKWHPVRELGDVGDKRQNENIAGKLRSTRERVMATGRKQHRILDFQKFLNLKNNQRKN